MKFQKYLIFNLWVCVTDSPRWMCQVSIECVKPMEKWPGTRCLGHSILLVKSDRHLVHAGGKKWHRGCVLCATRVEVKSDPRKHPGTAPARWSVWSLFTSCPRVHVSTAPLPEQFHPAALNLGPGCQCCCWSPVVGRCGLVSTCVMARLQLAGHCQCSVSSYMKDSQINMQ